jgi:NADPH-dependent 2,4-dienoyl-CoA reductase/sulfur reductase-like enzyme
VITTPLVSRLVETFKTQGRIVIVGASLAGLRAAETLREKGFRGPLTIIGDEPHEPYDRPPLSKQVLKGWVPADHTKLPRLGPVDAHWRLGVAAVGLDRSNRQVLLADGERVDYDRLLIATGTRARPWFNPHEAALEGLFTVRTCDDAAKPTAPRPHRRLGFRGFRNRLGVPRSRPAGDGRRAPQGAAVRRPGRCDR